MIVLDGRRMDDRDGLHGELKRKLSLLLKRSQAAAIPSITI